MAGVDRCCSSAPCYLFTIVPKGFLPSEDQGRFMVNTEAAQGISYDDMARHQMQVADDPRRRIRTSYMANVMVGAIGNNGGALNTGPHLGRAEAARPSGRCRSTR